jgi:ABC-type nitrate/sulfonate/bicarbonate transport system substrate-binding protein
MMSKRLTDLLLATVAVTAGFFASGVALAQGANLQTLKLGGGSFTTSVAQSNGSFAKYGLQIQIPRSASGGSDEVRKWLATGELDLAD